MSNEKIEQLRRDLADPEKYADLVVMSFLQANGGHVESMRMLLAAIPVPTAKAEAVAHCVVDPAFTVDTADSAIDWYLSNERDLPFIEREEWPKSVLVIGIADDGAVTGIETVEVLAWCEQHAPEWLKETDDE